MAGFGAVAATLRATGVLRSHPREWLERARAGRLTPDESAATVRAVYGLWVLALLFKALGSGWDVAWHFRWQRDNFAPPHDVNLIGDGLVVLLVLFHWYTRFGVDRRSRRLMQTGIITFLASVPVDVINHKINGVDITAWSVTHFGLYTGTAIMIAGVIRGWQRQAEATTDRDRLPGRTPILFALWFFFLENVLFPSQHQEYGVLEIASWDRGRPYAEPSLLKFAADQIGRPVDRTAVVHFSLPIPSWVYPLWMTVAAMTVLVLARRSVGPRWTSTSLATGYVIWRFVLWVLFAVGGFPHSALPFVLVLGGVVIDVVILAEVAPAAEAIIGASGVTVALYLGLYLQSHILVAPPAGYWSAPYAAAGLAIAWLAARAGTGALHRGPRLERRERSADRSLAQNRLE
jgi:hypothetical protein